MRKLAESELVLNADGSIYHLNLHPEDIADTILLVGDPNRVEKISRHFDAIELKKSKREFVTHTGNIGNKRLTVISTGMGPGNIDIFMNELDALVNIDLNQRQIKESKRSLSLIRLGTSGSLHPDLQPGDLLMSRHAIGFDTVMSFYQDKEHTEFSAYLAKHTGRQIHNYWSSSSADLDKIIGGNEMRGTTLTCPGFYGAQNRALRLPYKIALPFDDIHRFKINDIPITNMEMETSVIYSFAELLGHKALSVNCILANRIHGTFCKSPKAAVERMIEDLLDRICAI